VRGKPRLPLEQLQPRLLDRPAADAGPIDWRAVFGNDRPVEIEVGFGKGGWLVDAAAARPEANFLGIEVMRGLQLYAATRLVRRGLTNARVVCADARDFLARHVVPGSVAAIHVYFPDPWWKARHKKRRVFNAEFAAAAERALTPDGRVCIATDVEEYFGVMTALMAERPAFRQVAQRVEAAPPEQPMTNFERKAHARGGSVWRAEYAREPDAPTSGETP
jgi:tRNA (guanine-N7-)-methyltransferase